MPSRWNLAYRFDVLDERIRRLISVVASAVEHLNTRFDRLERLIMTGFADASADLDRVTTEVADRMEARDNLVAMLREAVTNGEMDKARALAEQDAQHASVMRAAVDRLRGIGADQENPVPDTTPLPEAPVVDAPADAPVEQDPVIDPE